MKKCKLQKKLLIMLAVVSMISGCSYLKKVFDGKDKPPTTTVTSPVSSVIESDTLKTIPIDTTVVISTIGKSAVANIGKPKSTSEFDRLYIYVAPSPLATSCDSVRVRYDIYFPKDYISPYTRIEITPVLEIGKDTIINRTIAIQGDSIKSVAEQVIYKNGGVYSGNTAFTYTDGDYSNVHFMLIMRTIESTKNALGTIDTNTHTDTLYSARGISLADRLLNTETYYLVAYQNDSLNNLPLDTIKHMLSMNRDTLKTMLDHLTTDAMVTNNMGILAVHTGNYKKAKEKFMLAMVMDSTLYQPRHNLGVLALEQRDYPLARTYFSSIDFIATKPDVCRALWGFCRGEYEEMIASSSGSNKALAELLDDDTHSASLTVKDQVGESADLVRMVIFARQQNQAALDSMIYIYSRYKPSSKELDIIKNENSIYKKL